jgi:ADP-ribose pyrophosphatase YjhB (NUDIX family)
MRHLAVGLCVRATDGAILVEHGHDRVTGARFYRAIGGACEPGEAPADAVVREWQEEFALAVRVVRVLGTLDNRFVYEGRAGREHVTAFEVAPHDPGVYAAERLEGRDPAGQAHLATWVTPAALEPRALEPRALERHALEPHALDSPTPPLYPAGVLALLPTAG